MVNYKNILTGVAERLSVLREERPSAGTRYRLMGMVADIMEVAETLQKEVLERVRQGTDAAGERRAGRSERCADADRQSAVAPS